MTLCFRKLYHADATGNSCCGNSAVQFIVLHTTYA